MVLKFVIRSFSEPSCEDSAAKIFCWLPISLERSWSSVPSDRVVQRSAPPRSACSGVLERVVQRLAGRSCPSCPGPGRRPRRAAARRSARRRSRSAASAGPCGCSSVSVPSTWSSCTGAEVCETGIVSPSSSVARARACPGGCRRRGCPRRRCRGRTLIWASLWIGRASSSSFIVTTTAGESPPTGSTFETLPTSTPAIRTACPLWIGGAFSKTALSWNGFVNGMSLVKPEVGADQDQRQRDQAGLERR